VALLVCGSTIAAAQTDVTALLPGAFKETDTTSLLSATRISALPSAPRAAWRAYLERSRTAQRVDQALLQRELQLLGAPTMTRAAFAAKSFDFSADDDGRVFATDSASRMAASMLSYQTPSGGWSKHIDFTHGVRLPGQSFFSENEKWQYIATIDNDATTSELRFLMRFLARRQVRASSDSVAPRVRASVVNGVRYLLAAQFPNGCWPQVWPLQGGYHDNATFNDDAIAEVLGLLDEVAHDRAPYVPATLRVDARRAVKRGVQCVLDAQVRVNDTLTVWGQQHDPITLAPASARSYELVSLTSKESAGVFEFLMAHATLDARIGPALAAAAEWLDRTAIRGMRNGGTRGLIVDSTAGDLWARMYELGTNRPIFSNRDGVKQYDFNALTDRREGYGWYSDLPAATLTHYRQWLAARPTARHAARVKPEQR
jgi:PelA/Pel-15E family pectate lyase